MGQPACPPGTECRHGPNGFSCYCPDYGCKALLDDEIADGLRKKGIDYTSITIDYDYGDDDMGNTNNRQNVNYADYGEESQSDYDDSYTNVDNNSYDSNNKDDKKVIKFFKVETKKKVKDVNGKDIDTLPVLDKEITNQIKKTVQTEEKNSEKSEEEPVDDLSISGVEDDSDNDESILFTDEQTVRVEKELEPAADFEVQEIAIEETAEESAKATVLPEIPEENNSSAVENSLESTDPEDSFPQKSADYPAELPKSEDNNIDDQYESNDNQDQHGQTYYYNKDQGFYYDDNNDNGYYDNDNNNNNQNYDQIYDQAKSNDNNQNYEDLNNFDVYFNGDDQNQ